MPNMSYVHGDLGRPEGGREGKCCHTVQCYRETLVVCICMTEKEAFPTNFQLITKQIIKLTLSNLRLIDPTL